METQQPIPTAESIKSEIQELTRLEHEKVKGNTVSERHISIYNNFGQKLPGGLYEVRDIPLLGRDYSRKQQPRATELYRSQTLGEFVDTVNQTVVEVGGEDLLKKLRELNSLIFTPPPGKDVTEYGRQLEQLAEPVYIALRLKGYSHDDLTM